MIGYLLDTHIWFWYLTGSLRLPVKLREVVASSSDRCWLSPISVWELGLLASRRRVGIVGDYRAWLDRAHLVLPLKEAHLNREIALKSTELDLPHRDPADHFLAATALVFDLTLLTVDDNLTSAAWLPTLSV